MAISQVPLSADIILKILDDHTYVGCKEVERQLYQA